MYVKDRPRAGNLYTLASNLVFPKSTKGHENKTQIQPEYLVSRKKQPNILSEVS